MMDQDVFRPPLIGHSKLSTYHGVKAKADCEIASSAITRLITKLSFCRNIFINGLTLNEYFIESFGWLWLCSWWDLRQHFHIHTPNRRNATGPVCRRQ